MCGYDAVVMAQLIVIKENAEQAASRGQMQGDTLLQLEAERGVTFMEGVIDLLRFCHGKYVEGPPQEQQLCLN